MVDSLDDLVVGLNLFREHFADYQDRFVIIGGAACKVILSENGEFSRATKDLDIVLCLDTSERIDEDFAKRLLEFIEAGQYQTRIKASGVREYYRFENPKTSGYPIMLEFFSRHPNSLPLSDDQIKCRLVVEGDLISLSAILLDDYYYQALLENKIELRGLPLLNENLLIPFKARAHIDLERKKAAGDPTAKSSDIKKHRTDIIRLLALIPPARRVPLSDPLRRDVGQFMNKLAEEGYATQQVVPALTLDIVLSAMEDIFQVKRDEFPFSITETTSDSSDEGNPSSAE